MNNLYQKETEVFEVEVMNTDTFSDMSYNSFRRDKEKSGRQYSAIWLDF